MPALPFSFLKYWNTKIYLKFAQIERKNISSDYSSPLTYSKLRVFLAHSINFSQRKNWFWWHAQFHLEIKAFTINWVGG